MEHPATFLSSNVRPTLMSSTPILLPSCTEVHETSAGTVSAYLPDSGTLPSLSRWEYVDSSIPTSQSSPHKLQFPGTRLPRVTQGRRTKAYRCSENALSWSSKEPTLTTLSASVPLRELSTPPLLTERISAISTTSSLENRNSALFWESPSIPEDLSYHDSIEEAQCLVYRSMDDCLASRTSISPQLLLQQDAISSPAHISEEEKTASEDAFSSNMAIPLKTALRSAPRISPRFSTGNPFSEFFMFAVLTESISRLSGELAASVVAGYQNHYGGSVTGKHAGEKSFGWRSEWEKDMRALEMDQWIPDGNAL